MLIQRLITLFSIASAVARGDPMEDMHGLQSSCENAANRFNASLNNTRGMYTADLIQNIAWQVGASKANLGNANSTTTPSNNTESVDFAYFDYVDAVRTLSEAVSRRGRVFHQELNRPEYNALRGLAAGVQAYGLQLRNAGLISQSAYIRTLTAGSSVVEAESVWANNANYPWSAEKVRSSYERLMSNQHHTYSEAQMSKFRGHSGNISPL